MFWWLSPHIICGYLCSTAWAHDYLHRQRIYYHITHIIIWHTVYVSSRTVWMEEEEEEECERMTTVAERVHMTHYYFCYIFCNMNFICVILHITYYILHITYYTSQCERIYNMKHILHISYFLYITPDVSNAYIILHITHTLHIACYLSQCSSATRCGTSPLFFSPPCSRSPLHIPFDLSQCERGGHSAARWCWHHAAPALLTTRAPPADDGGHADLQSVPGCTGELFYFSVLFLLSKHLQDTDIQGGQMFVWMNKRETARVSFGVLF
jgi:hypothetical protein